MSVANCPKCSQQLDLSSVQAGSVIQCPCGARLKTPKGKGTPQTGSTPSQLPSSQQNPVTVDPLAANPSISNDPFGLGNLTPDQLPPPSQLQPGQFQPSPHQFVSQQIAPQSAVDQQPNSGSSTPQQTASPLDSFNLGLRFITIAVIIGVATNSLTLGFGTLIVFEIIQSLTWQLLLLRGLHLVSGVGVAFYLLGLIKCHSLKTNTKTSQMLQFSIASAAMSLLFELGVVFGSSLFLLFGAAPAIGPMVASAIFLLYLGRVLKERGQNKKADEIMQLTYFVGIIATVYSSVQALPSNVSILITLGALVAYFVWAVQYISFLGSLEVRNRKSTESASLSNSWGQNR